MDVSALVFNWWAYGIVAVIIVAACILAALWLRKKKTRIRERSGDDLHADMDDAWRYKPRTVYPAVKASDSQVRSRTVAADPPVPPVQDTIDLVSRADINDSLGALVTKYSLDQITIATADGLVLAASGAAKSARNDAALYSEVYARDPLADTDGVTLISLDHRGSSLLCIIRSPYQVPEERKPAIKDDTKDILNRWI
jgi:hypothetical protein